MKKPTVHYTEARHVSVGMSAVVRPLDHPSLVPGQHVTNTKWVITSTVIRHDAKTGEFETERTIYVPLLTTH